MAEFMSLSYELRAIIYQYVWELPLSYLECIEVVDHDLVGPCLGARAAKSFQVQDGGVSRTYAFYPVQKFVHAIQRLALINRRCYLEVTDLLFQHLTFGIVLGIPDSWKDWVGGRATTYGKLMNKRRNGPAHLVNSLDAINTDLLARIMSLKLTIRDIVDRGQERLRLQSNLEAFILRFNQTPHNLKNLVVIFDGVNFAKYNTVRKLQRYQYLLEPLVALRVPEVRIEGVSQDFATKMAAVMMGQYSGKLQEIDYDTETGKVDYWRDKFRKTAEAELEMEARRPRKPYYHPKYDWSAIEVLEDGVTDGAQE